MGKHRDMFWDHAEVISNEGEGTRWKCKFCHKLFSGGASRIKAHLGKVEREGIRICEAVDQDTMEAAKEAMEAPYLNKRSIKRRRLESRTSLAQVIPQEADLPRCLPFLAQSNSSAPTQGSPDASHGIGSPRQREQMDLDCMSTGSSFGESIVCARMQELGNEILPEGPANTKGYISDQNNLPCSSFDTAEADRSDWHQHGTLQPQYLPSLLDDQCSLMVRDLQAENVSEPTPEFQHLQPDGPVLLPMNAPPSLAESAFNVPLQGTSDPVVVSQQPNHFDPMQIDSRRGNDGNEANAFVIPQPSSVARSAKRGEILAPKPVGREWIVNEICDYLMTNDILCIGIYGMGGVGKTTIVKRLYNKVCPSAAFEDVFMITVSRDCSIHELQNKIAKVLEVPDLFKDIDELMRPTLLFNHLSKKKNSLIILDDLWQHFELKEVGIPLMKDGVRLVLTTRDFGVCQRMLCEKIIGVEPLTYKESWALFVEAFGSDLSPSWVAIAENIVKECGGLPLAIVVMAGSMRRVDSDRGWEDTLEKLRQPEALQQDMKTGVFPILEHSYNRLDAKKQQCLLWCALYPEDQAIYREDLIEFYIDEGVIRGDRRWKMHNEGHQLLDELIKECLLEDVGLDDDGNGGGGRFSEELKSVRMHDVIRDMALSIMTVKSLCMVKSGLCIDDVPGEEEWMPNLQKVSLMSNEIEVVPPISPNCPQLSTLLLSSCWRLLEISECFFECLQGLKVIDLSRTRIRKVPDSVMNLDKLNALLLRECDELSFLSSLANLTSLRKLDLRGCKAIKETPHGLEMLINLTYLDLSGTSIERMPHGVISKLLKLQHLRVDYIEVKGEEVGKLKKLELLRCRFLDEYELNDYTRHAAIINSYILLVGAHTDHWFWNLMCESMDKKDHDSLREKVIILCGGKYDMAESFHLPRNVKALRIDSYGGTWNMSSFTRLEELEVLHIDTFERVSALSGEQSEGQMEELAFPPPPRDHFPNLKVLRIANCPKLKLLSKRGYNCCNMYFKKLEVLHISDCWKLKSIIGGGAAEEEDALPPEAFSELQSIGIYGCPEMKNVVGPELLPRLHNLWSIKVNNATNMEEVIEMPPRSATSTLLLPLLTSIQVWRCHKMKRVLTLELFMLLPNLERINVWDCQQMEEVIGQEKSGPALPSSTTAPTPEAAFSQLQSIQIRECPKMKNAVGPELLPFLHNLRWIDINRATNMEEIIVMPSPPPLPAMATSPLLRLPLLTSMYIRDCEKMKRVLTPEQFLLLPNLNYISVKWCDQMKEVIGRELGQEGATVRTNNSCSLLSPTASSPNDQPRKRELTLNLDSLDKLESVCCWTGLKDLIHVIQIQIDRCPKLKRIEMLDHDGILASPPLSLEEIVVDGRWWESLEWVHPEAKTAIEAYVFIRTVDARKIPLEEWRGRRPQRS